MARPALRPELLAGRLLRVVHAEHFWSGRVWLLYFAAVRVLRIGDQIGCSPTPWYGYRQLMKPDVLAPLYMVAGAPGAGKTTLQRELMQMSRGIVVMDKDELLEDGALLGVPITDLDAAPIWPAYNRMWSRIINMVRRAGLPVIHLSTTPSPQDFAASRDSDGAVHWVLLDCPDQVRLARLRERAWSPEWIADAMDDARESRTLIPNVIRTDDAEPQTVARRVLDWIVGIDDRLNEIKHD